MTPTRTGSASPAVARYLGALFLFAAAAVHLHQYYAVYYRVIPVVGPLFLANAILGVVLGLALLAPVQRLAAWLPGLAAVGGILFAAGTIIGLQISETGTLFGFHEHGYRTAIVVSIAVEGAAIVSLAAYLVGSWASRDHPTAPPA
jgi:hypothetical protein